MLLPKGVYAQDITTNLVGHWKFDETSGTTATDSSGANNTGTLTNGPTWTTGKIGNAISFDGSDDYVLINDLDLTGSFTVSMWALADNLGSGCHGSAVMKRYDYGFELCNGQMLGQIGKGAGPGWAASTAYTIPQAGVWNHVTLTYDGTTARLYANGVQITTALGAHVTNNNPLMIGAWDTVGEFFDGIIDDVRIYNRALTSADISALYTYTGGPPDIQAPTTPTNLTASAISSSQINLSWNASTDNVGVTGYRVYRGGTQIASPSTTSYSDTGLSPSTTYSYTVAAVDGAGNISSQSTSAEATTQAPPPPDTQAPSAPTNLSATAISSSQINLSWSASTDNVGVTGYRVERCTGATCTTFAQISTPTTNSYNDTGLTANTTYRYQVRATDAANNLSLYSSIASATTQVPLPSSGTTYYISPSGSDSNSCTTAQNISTPKQTVQSGLSCLGQGTTLVLRDGTYSGNSNAFQNLPNGLSGNYITIKAENDGGAIVTADLSMDNTDSYIQFEGLRFHSQFKHILGNHIKFIRNEFKNGCSSGNCTNTTVGTRDFNNTADILLEDNWWHGPGGRYNLLVSNSDRVIVRRGVIRHDGNWTDTKGDPEAGVNAYSSSNVYWQNTIVLDSNLSTYHNWYAPFYSTADGAESAIEWQGTISLNNRGAGYQLDPKWGAALNNIVMSDVVSYKNDLGITLGSQGTVGGTISNFTIGSISGNDGIAKWSSGGSVTVNNGIIYSVAGNALRGVSGTYLDTYNTGNDGSGTGFLHVNPLTSGLSYLPRIENESILKTSGMGAQIVNQIGVSGTLQDELGWNNYTGMTLWPYPNESRIKKEMCADTGITRGFCSDTSLTNYIMNYLGNGNPYSGGAPPTLVGDLNQDRTVNGADWTIMANVWFTSDAVADINADGIVNSIDFSLMNQNWGRTI